MLPRRDARPLLALLVLVLVPGLILAFVGVRGVTERENSLRTQYLATAILVRDRLVAELARREQDLWAALGTNDTRAFPLDPPRAVTQRLDELERDEPWLTQTFLIHGDGLATRSLHVNWPRHSSDPLAAAPRAAALVAAAEAAEFVHRDLETALRHYRGASADVPGGSPAAAFLLARIGRTLFKMDRPADAITTYRQVLHEARDGVDGHGLPYAVIALVQVGDAHATLGRAEEKARAERELLQYIVDHPWDVADGFGAYLARGLAAPGAADAALLSRARALADAVADFEWLQREIAPRIQAARRDVTSDDDAPGHFVVQRDGRNVLVGFRWADRPPAVPSALGHVVRRESLAGEMLDGVVRTIDIDRNLIVRVSGRGAPAEAPGTPPVGSDALAEAPLFSAAPGWHVAVFDARGRSVAQLVARERWTYGALVLGMLTVMVAGLVLIGRTSRRAEELSKAKTEFVANVSHELKTPLALIRMFGETLESGIVPDEDRRREFAGVIRRESERLTHLINNVLDLGRIDTGTKRYQLVRGELIDTVRQALDAYRPLFDRLGFTVESDLPTQPIDLRMDRDAIIQSLVNLFQNVIKYSDQRAYVRVSVTRDGDWAHVSVADRGVGIPADDIPRVFEPYYRAASARDSAPAGSGLGLSIVQHAVAGHGGRVEVVSTPGAGSTFTLILPLASAAGNVTSREATIARAET